MRSSSSSNGSKGHTITDKEIQAIWKEQDLEKKRQMTLNIMNKCVDSVTMRSIIRQVQTTSSKNLIDKKITYLKLLQTGDKVIR